MNDLFDAARDRASCCTAAAMRLVPSLEGQDKITRALLNEAMTTAFGGSDADGRWTQRESFEVLELALALAMRNRSTDRLHVAHDDVLQAAVLLDRLPTQTVRSEEQIEWQQFSTPLDLAAVALILAAPMRSTRGDASRLEQIIAWAGDDFEGVIAWDEAHEMGGVAGGEGSMIAKKGSQQGIAGVVLQNRLPGARVLYASATGASEVNNLAYAVRLGLWGPETSFANREAFITEIRQGGIAAMELVARDLKATGLYTARALSFAGVEYDILRHELTPEQVEVYDAYADAWGIIHRNMEKALELTGVVDPLKGDTLNSGAKAAARSRFESCKQRFFGAVLLSCKLPTVIAAVRQHLEAGQSVVLQLVSTAEAILDRRLGELSPDERAELDLDLSPREAIIDYLQRAFPVQQMTPYRDDTGEIRSRPMFDERGTPVTNPEAEAARDDLIEQLCALPPIAAVLDGVLEHFGHDNVAEVTGYDPRRRCATTPTASAAGKTAARWSRAHAHRAKVASPLPIPVPSARATGAAISGCATGSTMSA
ncbi:strawberry notch-like NTP hydrolase domain-containing protein [Sphingomonas sp. TWP1-3-1]|uniref:strawberry notch-like NTP hydrolase domain-containing protein n=1 Tax=Sphingomonas sp. TWP1-3-1 TaxID=2804612 RepID=UPI003CF90F80